MYSRLESSIQTEIIKWLRQRPHSFTYKHPPYPAGIPDIHHLEHGFAFYFEVKRTNKDKARKLQKLRIKKLRKAGCICDVVYSLDDVKVIISKTLSKTKGKT